MVKPTTLGREVPGSSPTVAVRCGLEQVKGWTHGQICICVKILNICKICIRMQNLSMCTLLLTYA